MKVMTTTVKKQTRKEKLIDVFMAKDGATKEEYFGMIIVRYQKEIHGKLYMIVAIWDGLYRGYKPAWHHRFNFYDGGSEMEAFIIKQKEYYSKRLVEHNDREAKARKECEKIKPGAILYTSWGYDQTNIEYFQVIERKNTMVIVREVAQDRTYSEIDSGSCTPRKNDFVGEPLRKRINFKHASIKISECRTAWLWDGISKSWSSYH